MKYAIFKIFKWQHHLMIGQVIKKKLLSLLLYVLFHRNAIFPVLS